jgi:hypothetical protein
MPVNELGRRMSAREYVRWVALYRIEQRERDKKKPRKGRR